jgi:hypothetical protein
MLSENNGEPSPPLTKKRNNNNSGKSPMNFLNYNFFIITDSESDVNNDHLIGNVQRVAIVPPNYEGKPKRGHLISDASFECGILIIEIFEKYIFCIQEIWVGLIMLMIMNMIYSFDLTHVAPISKLVFIYC